MIYFSNLLDYRLVDKQGASYRLADLAVDLKGGDYPRVTYLLWKKNLQEYQTTSWDSVRKIDKRARTIEIESLEGQPAAEKDWLEKNVLLKRDILDALIIDLESQTTVLANDIGLDEQQDGLVLCGLDFSFRAILRRVSSGRIAGNGKPKLRDWKYIEFLRGKSAAAKAGMAYHGLIQRLPPGKIAYLADLLPYPYACELVSILPVVLAADTMEIMRADLQQQVFEELDTERAEQLLALMRPDVVTDLLSRLDEQQTKDWLEKLPDLQSQRVLELMHYPEDTVGGSMTNDMIVFPADMKVEKAISVLREQLKQPDFINFLDMVYVVNNLEEQKLVGALSMRNLLVAENDRRLEEASNPYLITLLPLENSKSAARQVVQSTLAALPVVDNNGRILGVMTIDTALGIATPDHGRREILRLYS